MKWKLVFVHSFLVTLAICGYYFINAERFFKIIKTYVTPLYYPVSPYVQNVNWGKHDTINGIKKQSNPSHPNVILIIADDMGFDDVKHAPNIQSIYKNGIRFTNAHSAQATCAPSRAALLSGRYPTKMGFEFTPHPVSLDLLMHFQNSTYHPTKINMTNVIKNPPMNKLALNKNELLISDILKQQNYSNYYLGKWHLGESDGYRPMERGYHESLSFLIGASMYAEEDDPDVVAASVERSIFDTYMAKLIPFGISYNNGELFKPDKYMTDYLSNKATDIITTHKDTSVPFFITIGYNAPHNPYQALKSDYDLENGTHNEKVYRAMIRSLDRGIGNIIKTLKEIGKYDDTLLIFTSDNGGTHLIELDGINYPFSGWKCTLFDGGIHVPMFWQWPNKIPKNIKYDKVVSHMDIFKTIASIVESDKVTISSSHDGTNLLPYILNETDDDPHEFLFWRSGNYKALKMKNWKLSICEDEGKVWLFDLDNDIEERTNLFYQIDTNSTLHRIFDVMENKLDTMNDEQMDPLWRSPLKVPIPIYNHTISSCDEDYVYWEM